MRCAIGIGDGPWEGRIPAVPRPSANPMLARPHPPAPPPSAPRQTPFVLARLQQVARLAADLRDPRARRLLLLPLTLRRGLREFYSEPLTVAAAEENVRRALADREERFLDLARRQIYGRPGNPYAELLRHAGCEPGDLARSVHQAGLDATLSRLAQEGVYLTDAEFKGKQDVVRGGLAFRVDPTAFDPVGAVRGFVTPSSGTSNAPVRSLSPLRWLDREAPVAGVFLAAHGLLRHAFATYEPVGVGNAGIAFLLQAARFGIAPERWFARTVPVQTWPERAYYQVTTRQLVAGVRRYGPGFPRPLPVDARDLSPIVSWVRELGDAGRPSCIRTVASNAARIARTALALGVSLRGATFISSGEPVTEGKRRVIEQAGATTTLLWGYTPGPLHVSYGCADGRHTDEMHVNEHMLAVVEHPTLTPVADPSIRPLLFTTLYPEAAKLQLNVANGDFAVLERRECGCALGRVGLSLHVHRVRSYEKLTSEGMCYASHDLFELLESVLPAEFGGGPGDYQLVEEEDADGQTRLTLLVHPEVGLLDERRVLDRLQEGLERGDRRQRFMAQTWRQAGTLRLAREVPRASDRGKVLPLHIAR